MELSKMSQAELLEIAAEFGTEATQDLNETQIITRLMEDGITQEMVSTFVTGKQAAIDAAAEDVVEEKTTVTKKTSRGGKKTVATVEVEEEVLTVPEQQLLVMDRENGTYRVRGYSFTREHPFALVGEVDAEYITENIEGFRYATPKEAREYYS